MAVELRLQFPDPDRLIEAQQIAEEALAIMQTLDPAASEIWKTYELLAQITDKQNDPLRAQAYRKQARQAKAAYAGTQYELQKWQPFIADVVAAIQDVSLLPQLEEGLAGLVDEGYGNLVAAIRLILQGERNEDVVCAQLNFNEAMIATAILAQLG